MTKTGFSVVNVQDLAKINRQCLDRDGGDRCVIILVLTPSFIPRLNSSLSSQLASTGAQGHLALSDLWPLVG